MLWQGVEICCPQCKGELHELKAQETTLRCGPCERSFPVLLGIPDLRVFSDPYIDMEADRAKGVQIAAHAHALSFAELVEFYYSTTSVVPAHHARQYTRGLLAGEARAHATLAAWEQMLDVPQRPAARSLLEIGCGTAPLLVAAHKRFPLLVGVDIAFRWLVVAKQRLAEPEVEVPLICACAEALPFPDDTFDWVVADAALELVHDQRLALQEGYRAMRPGGYLCLTTPNRYSLGPDPHTGLWAGSLLPDRWIAAYVRRQGGIPPKRRLLSARSLRRLIQEAGFGAPHVTLPDIPEGQRRHFGQGMQRLIDVYHLAKRLPVSRQLLRVIGPLLHAVAEKPPASRPAAAHQESV